MHNKSPGESRGLFVLANSCCAAGLFQSANLSTPARTFVGENRRLHSLTLEMGF
jgi:hypothetical protein